MAAVGADDAALLVEDREGPPSLREDQRHPGRHSRVVLFDVELLATRAAAVVLPRLHRDRLHGHHRAGHHRRAVPAAGHLAGPVLCPEDVDDLRPLVAVVPALLGRERERVEALVHDATARLVGPCPLVAARTVAGVEGHDLRLDLGIHVRKQRLHLVSVHLREFVLDDKPRDGVEVRSPYLHAEPRGLDERSAAAHEDVRDLEVPERPLLLVVGVVDVPHRFRRLGGVGGCLRAGGQECRAKHARAAPRPPLGHLVDGLAGVPLDGGDLVYGHDGEVHLEARLRAARIAEVNGLDGHRTRRPDRTSDLVREVLFLGAVRSAHTWHRGTHSFRDNSMNGDATSSTERPPCVRVG